MSLLLGSGWPAAPPQADVSAASAAARALSASRRLIGGGVDAAAHMTRVCRLPRIYASSTIKQ